MPNRLAAATSPYLLQHADNPVDWWEWGEAAFAEARGRDVPVLLSVGYSACHWCHVMAHESFEDPATAAYLNEHFVAVKVDREERPDVDAVYMQATQAMTGQGGWPMTVALTPAGEPFFAGTYFPDRPRHGQPAFREVLEALALAWRERRERVTEVAAAVGEHLRGAPTGIGLDAGPDAGPDVGPEPETGARATALLAREFDELSAGFGGAPKFPPSTVAEFLVRHAARTGSGPARRMCDRTCHAMARGGMYDQLGGGFARYAVDRDWVVPHFEKMLYDNALLLGAYLHWWRLTGDPLGERVARETADFLLAELRTPEGGFAASLDADSEGGEGVFYVWTPAELAEVLGPEDGTWAAALLSVSPGGTFEHGRSVLQLRGDPDDGARWVRVRRRLLAARDRRARPARDDKVVAAWNGLTIRALADAGALLGEPRYVAAAVAAGALLRDVHLRGGRLRRVSRDGVAGEPAGLLEDYACVAAGFLQLAQATADGAWVRLAGDLLEVALTRFAADDGVWFDTADDAEPLVARPRDPSDNATPSGHSALTEALVTYAALTGSGRHREAAERSFAVLKPFAARVPRFVGWGLAAAEAMLAGPLEIVVVGAQGDPAREALAVVARRAAAPGAVVIVTAPGGTGGPEAIPLLRGRTTVEGRAAAYVCRNLRCERPVTTPGALADLLGGS